MYKGIVLSKNYTNPPAPIQLITGAAGQRNGPTLLHPINGLYCLFLRQGKNKFSSFSEIHYLLRGSDTLSSETTLSELFLPPF